MALVHTVVTERGVVYQDQYCRVEEVNASKTEMSFDVYIYFTEQDAKSGMPCHRSERYFGAYNLFGDNPWVQAYAILKTYWPDAVDA